jgi:prophage antirepressor-like protein
VLPRFEPCRDGGLEDDEKGTAIVSTPGGEQEMLTVTEPGLYRLLSKSRKPIAKRFQRWVFHQVLPSIRKTGSYSLPQAETERMRLD